MLSPIVYVKYIPQRVVYITPIVARMLSSMDFISTHSTEYSMGYFVFASDSESGISCFVNSSGQ